MSQIIYINGEYKDSADATVSVLDHGLLYGDGVFEGIRIYYGKAFKLKEHTKRLFESARAISLDPQMTEDEYIAIINTTIEKNGLIDGGYVRAIITRGVGDLGLNPYLCKKPGIIVIAANITLYPKEFYRDGLKIITGATPRNMPEALNPKVKSLNYLNNIMAKIEGIKAGAVETLMLNHHGEVAECTGDNIFIIKDNVLTTPPENAGILVGITRDFVIELAQSLGYDVRQQAMSRFDIYTADECFLTGTAAEVIPAVELDGRSIGRGEQAGKVGPITQRLMTVFKEAIKSISEKKD